MKKTKLQRIAFHPDWHAIIAEMPDNLQGPAYRAIFDFLTTGESPLVDNDLAPLIDEIFAQIAKMKVEAARKAALRRIRRQKQLELKKEEERIRKQNEMEDLKKRLLPKTIANVSAKEIFSNIRCVDLRYDNSLTYSEKEEVALQVIDELDELIFGSRGNFTEFIRTYSKLRSDVLACKLRRER